MIHTEADGKDYLEIVPGPILDQAMYARYRAIKAYLDAGMNVIADDVVWKRDWLIDMIQLFEKYHVTFIGAFVADQEGERRERQRPDHRYDGWNRGSARAAHADAIYDIEIDTTHEPPQVLAQQLLQKLEACPDPTAFQTLRQQFLNA